MKFPVNPSKAIISGVVTAFFACIGGIYLFQTFWVGAVVCLIGAVVFGKICLDNMSSISISEDAVSLTLFNKERKKVKWENIQEVGLIGENVFTHKKNKTGDKYLYFSPVEMSEQERFQMIVKWPPKNMLYLEYGERQLETVMSHWNGELKTYNVADIFPDTEEESSNDDAS